jgi:hypothetical protein
LGRSSKKELHVCHMWHFLYIFIPCANKGYTLHQNSSRMGLSQEVAQSAMITPNKADVTSSNSPLLCGHVKKKKKSSRMGSRVIFKVWRSQNIFEIALGSRVFNSFNFNFKLFSKVRFDNF